LKNLEANVTNKLVGLYGAENNEMGGANEPKWVPETVTLAA